MFHRQWHTIRQYLLGIVFVLLSTAIVVACAQNSVQTATNKPTPTHPISAMTIKAMEFSYDQPRSIAAGLVDITFINNGAEPHHAQIARLKDGVTLEQLKKSLQKPSPAEALSQMTVYGGPNVILPGKSQEIILNLPTGDYVSLCFVAGKDHVPHFAKGMMTPFTVTPTSNKQQIPFPKADAEILLKDFSFRFPQTIPSGQITLKVTNQGRQPHEITLYKLAAGKHLKDMMDFLHHPTGSMPGTEAGGVTALASGTTAWLKLNLEPGEYVGLCFVPDPQTGEAHVMMGMTGQFTVQ